MDSIRILHASDLHIAEFPSLKSPIDRPSIVTILRALRYKAVASTYDPTILKPFCDFVLSRQDVDVVMLTGDIATTGDYRDVMRAYQVLKGPSRCVHIGRPYEFCPEGSLENLKIPIYLIPGNHDRFRKTKNVFFEPGAEDFHRVFNEYWDSDVRAYPVLGDDRFAVSLIGADFSLRRARDCGRSPLNKFAQGRVYDDVLSELITKTETIQRETITDRLVVLWAIHFPPDFPGQSTLMKLIDSKKIIRAANTCEVKAILTGHTHDQLTYRKPHMNFDVYCAGTATEFQPRFGHSFQILTISDGMRRAEISIQHYGFDRRLGRFREVSNT